MPKQTVTEPEHGQTTSEYFVCIMQVLFLKITLLVDYDNSEVVETLS